MASPPALPRREGAGSLNGENDKLSDKGLATEAAPSIRGRAGGEATKAFLTYEDILP